MNHIEAWNSLLDLAGAGPQRTGRRNRTATTSFCCDTGLATSIARLPKGIESFKLVLPSTTKELLPIRRPMRAPAPVQKDGPRVNEDIRNLEIQLIDQNGTNHGTVKTQTAIQMAADAGFDLVEISPNTNPPVCKFLDYGKFKYSAQKKAAEARKKQKVVEIKEIKLRPMIDDHD